MKYLLRLVSEVFRFIDSFCGKKQCIFTLAEFLITSGIIGIFAAQALIVKNYRNSF